MRWLLSTLAVTLLPAFGGDYSFTLGGKEYSGRIEPVFGQADAPAEGDVLWVYQFPVVLGPPGKYEFRFEGEESSVLMGRLPGAAEERPLAVSIDTDYKGDQKILIDPLTPMAKELKAGLRGVVISEELKDPAATLAGIDWSHAVLEVDQSFKGKNKDTLADLPEGLRYFTVSLSVTPSLKDFSSIKKASGMVWLNLGSGVELEGAALAGMSKLRNLSAAGADLAGTKALGGLTDLRYLDLSYVDGVEDLGFAATLGELREIELTRTAVSDLRPLGGLKHLEKIDADRTAVKELPEQADMPALKRLSLLSAPVAEAKVEAFRKQVPHCEVASSWHASLLVALKDVDRLRVRTGGTCHRDVESEQTLFEIADVAEIRREVESWRVNDEKSGFHCMCCGEPSLEFYKNGKLVTTLGFHHGRSLRWPEGWPGDALLTEVASDAICAMLARHGVAGPQKEREEGKLREAASHRLWSSYSKLVADEIFDQWRKASEEDGDFYAVAEKAWPDAQERAGRLFSLYGALPDRRWRLSAGVDEAFRDKLLGKVDVKDAVALVGRDDLQPELLQGLCRWAFFGKEGGDFLKALDAAALRKLGAWSLTHPVDENREETLYTLAGKGADPVAKELMLAFLAGKLEPRPRAAGDDAEPDGSVTYLPHQDSPPEGAGEKALCAWFLSGHKVEEARPLIEKLRGTAEKVDAEVFAKCLERLDGKAGD